MDASDRREIELAGYRFDPLDGDPELPDGLRHDAPRPSGAQASDTPRPLPPLIVQFTDTPDAGDRRRLRAWYGLELDRHLAEATYLERPRPEIVAALREDPLVRAVAPFRPAFCIDPAFDTSGATRSADRIEDEPGWRFVVVGSGETSREELRAEIIALGLEASVIGGAGDGCPPSVLVRTGDPADAARLACIPEVRWVEEKGGIVNANDTTAWTIQSGRAPDASAAPRGPSVWERGLRGKGQIIGHIDRGLDMRHCFFRDAAHSGPHPDHRKVVALRNLDAVADDGHGTQSAGCAVGEATGATPAANAMNVFRGQAPLSRISHTNQREVAKSRISVLGALIAANEDGAHIHTNSWAQHHPNATEQDPELPVLGYKESSIDVDRFTWDHESDLVLIAGHNDGRLGVPATAKNPLVVNATKRAPDHGEYFRGTKEFTADLRRKPDLCAPGEEITTSTIVPENHPTGCRADKVGGTSVATPAVAGAAALVREYYIKGYHPLGVAEPLHKIDPTGALLKATLLNATLPMKRVAPEPHGYPGPAGSGRGWGRLLLENALHFKGERRTLRVFDIPHVEGIYPKGTPGIHRITVMNSAEPLKITLVWTDAPGAPASGTIVVNNLTLKVTAPKVGQNAGLVYVGNHFGSTAALGSTGESLAVPDPSIVVPNPAPPVVPDMLNNVSMVILAAPAAGSYEIEVSVATMGVSKLHAVTRHDSVGYAVVASGALKIK